MTAIQSYNQMLPMVNTISETESAARKMGKAFEQAFHSVNFNFINVQLANIEHNYTSIENTVSDIKDQNDRLNGSIEKTDKNANGLKNVWAKISNVLQTVQIPTDLNEALEMMSEYQSAGNNLKAKTGMNGDAYNMAQLRAQNLYSDGLGSSLNEVAGYMATVYQLTGDAGTRLEEMTRAAMMLQDTFGFDIQESIASVEALTREFGISSAEAFDLLVQGAQSGLNRNGDLLETVRQNSEQFKQLGLSSSDMFNMLGSDVNSGTASVSALGDAVSEFTSRLSRDGGAASEGFAAVGLDMDTMMTKFECGGESSKQAFQQIVNAFGSMNDPIKQNIAGTNLFGSAWETLGYSGIAALSNFNGSMQNTTENLEELNSIKYSDATSALTSLGRTVNMGLAGMIGDTVNSITRNIYDFVSGLKGNVGQISGIFGGIGLIIGFVG